MCDNAYPERNRCRRHNDGAEEADHGPQVDEVLPRACGHLSPRVIPGLFG